MHPAYDPSSAEPKWQKKWETAKAYTVDLAKAKKPYYAMVMFPYPSGDKLHVGHWYNYSPADSFNRYMRMKGHDVFAPMGFDAFGLPAENCAIKTGTPPAVSTAKNVETMVTQLKRIGCMYDWEKTLNTSTPEYYGWTQWLFLQMFKHELAYKKEAPVNWCPKDQTVLANEQVHDGKCERCGTEVIQKNLTQWFWQITKYAQPLLDGLEDLDWPEKTKLMQTHWIGRSEGAEVTFAITLPEDHPRWESGTSPTVKVFTTRPDTLFGATYIVLAPEHPLVEHIVSPKHRNEVERYRIETRAKTEMQRTELNKEKSGVFTGTYVINPVTKNPIPIWIADYVLVNYGTGAIMAVPGHDERDHEFAQKHGLPIVEVVQPDTDAEDTECWTGPGTMINSGFVTGLTTHDAKKKMIAWLEDEEIGRGLINYRIRDWLVSRQRYWGAPIPIVYDPEGKAHPIPDKHLPWLLPTDVEFKPTGKSPLRESKEFIERTEKIFGKGWTPEFDTMDTFVCSSFYYLRYLAQGEPKTKNQKPAVRGPDGPSGPERETKLVDPEIESKWMPVDMYIGGPEHACMHLIYARFVMMALKDFGCVSHSEPFQRLVHQGLITNKGAKMSKSKGNVVSPDAFIDRHGSDVFRMYLMFMGPFTDGGDWSDTGIKGVDRFVQRAWKTLSEPSKKVDQEKELQKAVHNAIKRVTESMETLHFNTAISALMELLNAVEKTGIDAENAKIFTRLLSPLAPHLAEELWETLKGKGMVIDQDWPTFDPALLVSDTMKIVVQVNGKLRGELVVASDAKKEDVIAQAKALENVQKFLEGKEPKKEIYIQGKLVSLVV